MATTQVSDHGFFASLDESLSTAIFDEAGVSAQVEASIRHVLDVSTSHNGTHISPLKTESALEFLCSFVKIWRKLLPNDDYPIDKMSLGYAAASISKQVKWFDEKVGDHLLACMTDPLRTVKGAVVPKAVVEDILRVAGKTYLILRGATPEALAISELPSRIQAGNLTTIPFDPDARIFPGLELLQPGDRGHEVDYPAFRERPTIRVGKQRNDTANASKTKQTETIKSWSPGADSTRSSEESKTPANPWKGPGNHSHAVPVPWLQDELNLAETLLIVYRMSWQELVNALNAHFRNRPIRQDGKVIKRGRRTRAGVRQHVDLKFVHSNYHRLDEQSDPQHPSTDIDWAQAYRKMQAEENSEVEPSSGGEGEVVRPSVVWNGWTAINTSQDPDGAPNAIAGTGVFDSGDEDHDALGDIDEMLRRNELVELDLADEDIVT